MKSLKALYLLVGLLLFFNISGCVPLVVGGAGALGGYAIGRDTIEGNSDKPYAGIWNASLKVARIKGKLIAEDKEKGTIEFQAESSRIWIKLKKLSKSTTSIRVSARRYSLPNLKLAEDVFVKIMQEMG